MRRLSELLLELHLPWTELLMILSGREASVRRLDAIRQSVGDNPVHWYPLLTRAGWPGGDSDGDVMYLEAAE